MEGGSPSESCGLWIRIKVIWGTHLEVVSKKPSNNSASTPAETVQRTRRSRKNVMSWVGVFLKTRASYLWCYVEGRGTMGDEQRSRLQWSGEIEARGQRWKSLPAVAEGCKRRRTCRGRVSGQTNGAAVPSHQTCSCPSPQSWTGCGDEPRLSCRHLQGLEIRVLSSLMSLVIAQKGGRGTCRALDTGYRPHWKVTEQSGQIPGLFWGKDCLLADGTAPNFFF